MDSIRWVWSWIMWQAVKRIAEQVLAHVIGQGLCVLVAVVLGASSPPPPAPVVIIVDVSLTVTELQPPACLASVDAARVAQGGLPAGMTDELLHLMHGVAAGQRAGDECTP